MIETSSITVYLGERVARRELSDTSAEQMRGVLEHFAAFVNGRTPSEFDEASLSAWLGNSRWAPATVARHLSTVRGWSAWMKRRELIEVDPTAAISGPRQRLVAPRIATRTEVAALFRACRHDVERLMVSLMVQEGMRCGEVASLGWADIDAQRRMALVLGKGGHERLVPVSEASWRHIELRRSSAAGERIITNPRTGLPVTSPYVIQTIRRRAASAGLVGVSAHRLRATAATDMLSCGAHVRDVQQILGHRSLNSTSRYVYARTADMRRAIEGRSYE